MIDAIIAGKLTGKPTQRTGPSGKPFVTCKVRVVTEAEALLARLAPDAPEGEGNLDAFEAAYQRLKAELLEAGALGHIGVTAMDARLRAASALRRAVEQCAKAGRLLTVAGPSGDAETGWENT